MHPTADPGTRPVRRDGGTFYYAASYRAAGEPEAATAPTEAASVQPGPAQPGPAQPGPAGAGPAWPESAAPTFPPIPEFPTPPPFLPPDPGPGGFPAAVAPGPPVPTSPPVYGAVPVPPGRRRRILPIVIGVLIGVLLLSVAGAVIAYVTLVGRAGQPTAPTGAPTPASSSPGAAVQSGDEEAVTGDLARFKQGDCLTVDDASNRVAPSACTALGAFRVLLRKDGTTDDAVCEATAATLSLRQDAPGSTNDFVLCVGPAG